ncbi:MAG: hypothetical protein JRD89_20395, partial [Deltaproteobacteria bacterium]|nr:hypothetical protein [Deltaproteobacteria bacterium]
MAEDDELREQLRRLASEMEKLRDEIGGEIGRLAGAIGGLAMEMRERIRVEEVGEIREMVQQMRAFHEGLLLPWRTQVAEEMEARRL